MISSRQSHCELIMCGSAWKRRESSGPLATLVNVVLVDVDREFDHRPGRSGQMLLDVHRVHVAVFGERQRETPDGLRAVAKREVVPECLVRLENNIHYCCSCSRQRTPDGVKGRGPTCYISRATRTARAPC